MMFLKATALNLDRHIVTIQHCACLQALWFHWASVGPQRDFSIDANLELKTNFIVFIMCCFENVFKQFLFTGRYDTNTYTE